MHEIVHAKVYILVRMQFSSNTVMFSTKYFLSDTNEWSKSFVNIFFRLYNVVAWADEETPSTTWMMWLQWIKTYHISNIKRICFVISHIMIYQELCAIIKQRLTKGIYIYLHKCIAEYANNTSISLGNHYIKFQICQKYIFSSEHLLFADLFKRSN